MILPTFAALRIDPPLATPLSRDRRTESLSAQVQAARKNVGMAGIGTFFHIHIRGASAQDVLSGAFDTAPMQIGAVATISAGILVRLRRDEFVLLTPDLRSAMDRLAAQRAESLITLTDITHGRGVIALCGVRASQVLSKVCALDFADTVFPDRRAAQTSLAKVRALIIRLDAQQFPIYYLIVDRSLADYAWSVLYDAAQEWDGIALSQDALELMRKES